MSTIRNGVPVHEPHRRYDAYSSPPRRWARSGSPRRPRAALAAPTISISGATASYPLVSLLAAEVRQAETATVKFKIAQGGSQVGINDVAASRVSIGDVSRESALPPDPPAGLVFYPIAKYAICVVTNKSNPLSNLTPAQLVSIFTGKTRSWSQVPGATASGTIDLISRTSVAGVLTSFQTLLLRRQESLLARLRTVLGGSAPPGGRKRPERDRLPVQLPGGPGLGQFGRLQRRGLQQVDRRLRSVCGRRAVLRGDARLGDGLRLVVHQLDLEVGGRTQDHRQPVGADHLRERGDPPDLTIAGTCSLGCVIPGPITAPSVRSAGSRCSWGRA